MYVNKSKILGEEKNPFTGEYQKVYSFEKEKIWVAPEAKKEKFASNLRAVASGKIIEIYEYEEPIYYGYGSEGNGKNKISEDSERRSDSVNRTKQKIRRLINSNMEDKSKFVTLTYKDNELDVSKAKEDFKKFIKRLNYRLSKDGLENVKYLYVIEFQKRGSIHFHCVFFNLDYIKKSEFEKIWKNGFIKINKIDNCDNVGAYVVKYMNKEIEEKRLNNFDLYGRSKDLKEPIIIKKPQEVNILFEAYKNKIVFSKDFNTEYKGKIKYCQINLNREIK